MFKKTVITGDKIDFTFNERIKKYKLKKNFKSLIENLMSHG